MKEENKEQIIEQNKNKMQKNKRSKTRIIIVLIVSIITAIVAYVIFRGRYLETIEIGNQYINVFWKNIRYMLITLIINFLVIYYMIYITNIKIKKGLKEFLDQENKEMPKLINKSIAFIVAILISSCTSSFILEKAMLCFKSAQFGIQDPIFNLDIGYFIFQKPFIELVLWYFAIAVVLLLIYKIAYYISCFNLFFDGIDRKTLKNSKLIKQITTLIFIFAIILSCLILLKTQNIGTEKFLTLKDNTTSYYLYGAGITDVTIKLWGYRILSIIIIISVYTAIKAFKQRKNKKLALSIIIVPVYLVCLFLVLIIFKSFFVTANELDKEKEYIANNIEYTKNAYGINIEEISLTQTEAITQKDIEKEEQVINNISIVNKDIVLKDLKNGQTAKGYYSYRNTQLQKYTIDGEEQLIYVSPREIVSSKRYL